MGVSARVQGQTVYVWDGSSSTAWSTAANWSLNAAPGAADIARFNANTSRDPTIGGTATAIGRLEFLTGADSEAIGGTATLTIAGTGGIGITNSSGVAQSFTAGVAISAGQTWTTSGAGSNLTLNRTLELGGFALTLDAGTGTTIALSTGSGDLISSAVAGGSLIKSGTGTLTLGNVANTFDGGVHLNAGTVTVGHNASLGTGTLTLAGGTLNAAADRTLANNLTLSATSTISGGSTTDFIFSSNTVTTSGGTLNLSNTAGTGVMSVGFSGTGFTFSRPVAFADAFTQLRVLNTSGTQTFSVVISGDGSVQINAPGGAATFSAANTFTGGLTLTAGTLSANNNAALGTGTLTLAGGTLTSIADRTFANAVTLSGTATLAAGSGVDLTFSSGTLTTTAGSLTIDNTADSGVMSVRFTGDTFTFSRPIAFADAFTELRLSNAANTQTFSGVISGSGAVVRNTAGGETVLSGANTYTGGTTVSAGTLTVSNNAALGTGALTLAGGTLNATADRTLANNLTLAGTSTITGTAGANLIFSSDTITTTAGTLNLGNASGSGLMSAGFSGSGFTFTRPIALTDAFTELRFLNTAGTQTFSGVISGAGSLLQNGAGGTVVLSASNTFTGAVNITAGTLKLGAAGGGANTPLGSAATGTTVGAGGALDLNGFSLGTAEDLTLNGTGVGSTGALINTGGAATYQGVVTLNTASSIGGTGNLTLTAGLAGTGTLTKVGANVLTLAAASTRSGGTVVSGGTLKLADANAPGGVASSLTLAGGTLDLATNTSVAAYPVIVTADSTLLSDKATTTSAGITHTLGTLALNGGRTLSIARGGNVTSGTAGVEFGAVTLGSTGATFDIASGASLDVASIAGNGRSFSVAGAGNMNVNGAITTTTGTVTMNGSGTLTLSGNSTYSGVTTINSGTVALGAAGGATNTPLGTIAGGTVVNAGGTLDVKGFTLGTAEALSLSGSGSGAGALINSSPTAATWSGAVTLAGATTISGSGDLTLTGAMSGSGVALTKTGTNTLAFSGTTSTVGATALDAGALGVLNGTTLNTGAISSTAGATLIIASGGTVVADYASGSTTFAGKIAPNFLDGIADTVGGGTFQKNGAGTLVFTGTFNAGDSSTLVLNGGTLSLLGANATFGTIHFTANTVLDFNASAGTVLSSAALVIDAGVTVTVNNWISVANNSALSTTWFTTGTINGVALSGTDLTGGALNQIVFTNYTGLTTTWVAPPNHNGWFTNEVRPAPEPATYGLVFAGASAGLVWFRRRRRRSR